MFGIQNIKFILKTKITPKHQKNTSNKICISRDKSLSLDENKKENTQYGDSMVERTDERKIPSKRVVKVRKFP